MSRIHFVGGEKGGVGKSVFSRLLAQWCIDRTRPFAAIDADQSHGALLRFYAEYTQPVDLASADSADQIMDRALGSERTVLVDLPGQSVRALASWLSGADVFGFAREMGVQLILWHVSDASYASSVEIGQSLELFGDQARHIAVRNYGRASDFAAFDASDSRRKLDDLGGQVIDLPALDTQAMFRIDALGASFWAAANATDGAFALRPLERQRVRLWLSKAYAPLDAMAASL